MKALILFAALISASTARADETYTAFKKLQTDASALTAALAAGGYSDNGLPCTFVASVDTSFDAPVLRMSTWAEHRRRFSLMVGFDMNDRLLSHSDELKSRGSYLRTYYAFGKKMISLFVGKEGDYRFVKIYGTDLGDFHCNAQASSRIE